MTYRTRNIMIAVALAVIAALLTMLYVSNYKRNVRNAESSVTVWVASKDISTGLTGEDLLKKHLLGKQEVAKRNVVPGAISSTDQLDNQVVTQQIYAGEQVTARRFGSPTELYERPTNAYVASFIGSPPMNFLDGRAEGDGISLPAEQAKVLEDVFWALLNSEEFLFNH